MREWFDAQPRRKTQVILARELGVSQSILSLYLSGDRIPSREVAIRLSRQLNIPLEGLLDPEVAKAS